MILYFDRKGGVLKFYAKSIPDPLQIASRADWCRIGIADGVEILLRGYEVSTGLGCDQLATWADHFPKFNLEIGDRISNYPNLIPADLLDPRVQQYIEDTLTSMERFPNSGLLIVHLSGGMQFLARPYSDFRSRAKEREDLLGQSMEYLNRIDPGSRRIALENPMDPDWMNESSGNLTAFTFGKVSSDFADRARVFDPAHSGISAFCYANIRDTGKGYGFFDSEEFGAIPLHYGQSEREFCSPGSSTRESVLADLGRALPYMKELHVNTFRGLLDGFGFGEADLPLEQILNRVKHRSDLIFVSELREEAGDYLNAPANRAMLGALRSFFS